MSTSLDQQERSAVTPAERAEVEQVVTDWDRRRSVGDLQRLGGLTNRIFKVRTAATTVAVRLPGLGTSAYIDREVERHNATVASELGIGCRVLHAAGGALVTGFIEGRVLSPEVVRTEPDTLARAARLLGRLHATSRRFAGRFDPLATIARHRASLDAVPPGTDALIGRLGRPTPPARLVPCHVDPVPENFIDAGDRLHLLDWEYSAMGDPAWDLADLAVEADLDAVGRDALVAAYRQVTTAQPVDASLRARVDALAPVTDVLWGLWALVQDRDGNPADDFVPYAQHRLDRAASRVAVSGW